MQKRFAVENTIKLLHLMNLVEFVFTPKTARVCRSRKLRPHKGSNESECRAVRRLQGSLRALTCTAVVPSAWETPDQFTYWLDGWVDKASHTHIHTHTDVHMQRSANAASHNSFNYVLRDSRLQPVKITPRFSQETSNTPRHPPAI